MKALTVLLITLHFVSSSVTFTTAQLFQNTLKRWGVQILNNRDRTERWNGFLKAKESVETSTTGVVLQSLNMFSVLNNTEYEVIAGRLIHNSTYMLRSDVGEMTSTVFKRSATLAPTMDYWEKVVGLSGIRDQMSCGSCWSFPNICTMEAMNRHLTGDVTEFSEQYFVNCPEGGGNGCAGGYTNQGIKQAMVEQYLLSSDFLPYTADYQPCKYTSDKSTFKNNALTKIWVQDFIPLGINEHSFMGGLSISPVSFGTYVGMDFFHYSGGIFEDKNCQSDPSAHAMLLVGYSQATLRVRNSYGAWWGDGGYVNYKRGSPHLANCRLFEHAYAMTATYRRELEYDYCSGGKLVTFRECKTSCQTLNSQPGWSLAVIPTMYHNNLLLEKLAVDYPGANGGDKFNLLWMGLLDLQKDMNYIWADSFTPVQFWKMAKGGEGRKWGLINKINGKWQTKSSETFQARGLCSRAKQCWNIDTAVDEGTVTFSKSDLSEGTKATVACRQGNLKGDRILTCVGGLWDKDLPTCSENDPDDLGSCSYTVKVGTGMSLFPDKTSFLQGEAVTVTCTAGSTSTHTCLGGLFTPTISPCGAPKVCSVVEDEKVVLEPSNKFFFLEGEELRATCVNDSSLTDTFTCKDGFFTDRFNPEDLCSGASHAFLFLLLNYLILVRLACC